MTDRDACIILNLISGIGYSRLQAMASKFGSYSEIFNKSKPDLISIPNIGDALAEKIVNWEKEAGFKEEMDFIEKAGVEIITLADENYPEILKEIHDPPLCLYVRGTLPDLNQQSLAIVGSRRISTYGKRMAEHLAESAAYSGFCVVSGLAFGIDAIAHKATLEAGGKTVAVLGGGLARIHPQDHVNLAKEITENGAVISEFPMKFSPNRRSFPMRNRTVSGMTRATLVVEAGTNSGSLITANFALEQNRLVFAVPGNADSPQSRGCNSLIKQGAKLTENFDDILEEFEFLPGFQNLNKEAPSTENDQSGRLGNLDLNEPEKQIVDLLAKEELNVDQIASQVDVTPGKLLALMMQLEMKKVVQQLPGKAYRLN